MNFQEILQDIFTSGPSQLIGYAMAITFLGVAAILILYLFKRVLKPQNIHAKIGDNEIHVGLKNQDDSNEEIPSQENSIDLNTFLEIIKIATHSAFVSAQKRLEMKEKLYNTQYQNAWQTLHTFILQLNANYNIQTTDRRNQTLVKYALEYDLNNIMKEDFKTLFKTNHIWSISDSQLEVKINALADAICAKMKTRFIDYGNEDVDVLNTVFDGMKAQLYNNISQIMISAKNESSQYHKSLNKEAKEKYEKINNILKKHGIDHEVEKQEEDKYIEEGL